MNREKLYQKSVDLLLDAYNEEKLSHGNPCACAVGNLIKGNNASLPKMGKCVLPGLWDFNPDWFYQLLSLKRNVSLSSWANVGIVVTKEEAERQLNSTGYSVSEIIRIEHAFESMEWADMKEYTQFHGLKAVLNVLKDIHSTEVEIAENNQSKLEEIHNNVLRRWR